MKFLGTIDESVAEKMSDILRTRTRTLESFTIMYSGVGAFPAIENPRVVWIGAEGGERLLQLFSAVEEVCTSLRFPRETRTFHAHVTIGRVKSLQRPNRLTAILKSVTFEPIVARCSEFCIMKSELHPTGSQYTVVQSIPLKL